MTETSTERVRRSREKQKAAGVSSCSVVAPTEHHKTLQHLGKLLQNKDAIAEGVSASLKAIMDEKGYRPYIEPETKPYETPRQDIEPEILNILNLIASELGSTKDKSLISRLERQVKITIDAKRAKQGKSMR